MITKDEALRLALEALMEATKIHASSCKCSACRAVIIVQKALAEQPAQRKPLVGLTDAQIMRIARKSGLDLEPPAKMSWVEVQGRHEHLLIFARAIEAAHGIKGDA